MSPLFKLEPPILLNSKDSRLNLSKWVPTAHQNLEPELA